MVRQFVISDTHFGHDRIIQYTQRPFKTVTEMDERMVRNWNHLVTSDDIVYHLGDFTHKPNYDPELLFRRLKGRKILIRGNHDRETVGKYLNWGWNAVLDSATLTFCGSTILLIHEPITYVPRHPIEFVFHGHIHNNSISQSLGVVVPDAHVNVSVEKIDYRPRLIETVLYEKRKAMREAVCPKKN